MEKPPAIPVTSSTTYPVMQQAFCEGIELPTAYPVMLKAFCEGIELNTHLNSSDHVSEKPANQVPPSNFQRAPIRTKRGVYNHTKKLQNHQKVPALDLLATSSLSAVNSQAVPTIRSLVVVPKAFQLPKALLEKPKTRLAPSTFVQKQDPLGLSLTDDEFLNGYMDYEESLF
jgi:hypothetical protein